MDKIEKATFAAGCFWGVEAAFRRTRGVRSTLVGYTGGATENPDYKAVCTGKTGHAEAVEVEFDPDEISYGELLEVFWEEHNPTQRNRQGFDIGTQYRSAIFTHGPEQEVAARASKAKVQSRYRKSVATEIEPASTFNPAEEYHQRYLEKRGMAVCAIPN
ncbi:MAG: peptide-methionine (S)-S-oxide reductase MsrA [Actinomycetota bacterium]|nr:peptide-methionine (S)-S-oxide reductase MsrA [Actinomycetota bacterium]